ncbi:hypothetical protein Glove_328g116 [Diversispora epigaea]|uniref:HECT domain-containing protein n=1 Tax=Diversispora epigaea TaxID=1348612 RepID=A0A397HQ37_9GLOM|nr:hypothetical protein Glove_328g116 [Diversispora epigaea]
MNFIQEYSELENLISFIVKYEIITIRELELIQLYKGFNMFNSIQKFLNELDIKEKCQSVLKFITGSIKIPTRRQIMIQWSNNSGEYNRVSYSSTCFSKICFSENYENPITFYNNLKSVLLECLTGIHER